MHVFFWLSSEEERLLAFPCRLWEERQRNQLPFSASLRLVKTSGLQSFFRTRSVFSPLSMSTHPILCYDIYGKWCKKQKWEK